MKLREMQTLAQNNVSLANDFLIRWNVRRVTSKQKRVGSKDAAAHLRFKNEIHQKDRDAADRLRSTMVVEVPAPSRKEIGFAKDLAIQAIYEDKKGRWVEEEFEGHIVNENETRSWYRDKNGKKRQSTGAILDTYVSIPPWWTRALCDLEKAGKVTSEQVKKLVAAIAMEAMQELANRSGYEPIHLAIHPESEANLHIHLGLATVSKENKLLGRSATGTTGKKGLRSAGDSNAALCRMFQHIPKGLKKYWYDVLAMGSRKSHEKDRQATAPKLNGIFNDDIALNMFIERRLEECAPGLAPRAKHYAQSHVQNWADKMEVASQNSPKLVAAELDALRAENQQLKEQVVTALKSENESLKMGLNALKSGYEQVIKENETLKSQLEVIASGEIEQWEPDENSVEQEENAMILDDGSEILEKEETDSSLIDGMINSLTAYSRDRDREAENDGPDR